MQGMSVFFVIFAISGFSGLIYESIWTHYLKLFLGHAAYAQTLVLAIFMGGMAVGSWLCSRYSARWPSLLKGYALAEGLVGLCALAFHPLFVAGINYAYATVMPSIGSPLAVDLFKWTFATLSILPQSVLLGMTFPLMSGAFLRIFPERAGSSVAMLYFSNSIGAVFGVLTSGFLLIRWVGLPGTVMTAGLVNIMLAAIVWFLARGRTEGVSEPVALSSSGAAGPWHYRFYLLVALITGAASFIYEIVWIRMLSLVLGSSTHAFELMLSAFILGLACGGLWIKRRIDNLTTPVRTLALVQVMMGLLALATLPLYNRTFGVMQWLMQALPKDDSGYLLFNLASQGIASAVMLPATFCAGMTLPLITYALIREGYGEKSIGAVYAANTVGAILGVFAAIHVGLPLLGLKGLLVGGASLDMVLGVVLVWSAAGYRERRVPLAATFACIAAVLLVMTSVSIDPAKMASGVYRNGELLGNSIRLLYHSDGKTATVSVTEASGGAVSIRTNGKVDAGINMTGALTAAPDEATMILLAALPLAVNPGATTVANIGFGSGLTTHTLLTSKRLREVDTIEIERKMVEASRVFRPRVDFAYDDPRGKVYFDDAKAFFSKQGKRYDIIISEPSNPWVSGVAGLFSDEFYRLVKRYLHDDGLFVQWLQLYEIDIDLVSTVMKALAANFPDYEIYACNDSDIVILARKSGRMGPLSPDFLADPVVAEMMQRIDIRSVQDLNIRLVGTKAMLEPFFNASHFAANSDYFPVLDQNAARARFLQANAQELLRFATEPLPVVEMLTGRTPAARTEVTPSSLFAKAMDARRAESLRDFLVSGSFPANTSLLTAELMEEARLFRKALTGGIPSREPNALFAIFDVGKEIVAKLSSAELERVWMALGSGASLSSPAADYLALFKAVGRRDPGAMVKGARTALSVDQSPPPPVYRYAVAAGLLGLIADGRMQEASAWWKEYGPRYVEQGAPGVVVRMLLALISTGSAGRGA